MAKVIDQRWGEGTAAHLKSISKQITKVNEVAISDLYREKVNALLKERGWTKYKWW